MLMFQEQNNKTWLYNLNEDPTEQKNLSELNPEHLKTMKALLYELDGQMAEPLWPTLIETPIAIDFTIDKIPDTEHETIIWSN